MAGNERTAQATAGGGGSAPEGPRGGLLTGNAKEFRKDRLGFFERCQREFGSFVRFRVGPKPALMLTDPSDIHDVVVERPDVFKRVPHYRSNRILFGEGLFRSEGELWQRQHERVDPLFSRETVVGSYLSAMVGAAERDIAEWPHERPFEALDTLMWVSVDAAAAGLWGVDLHAEGEDVRRAVRGAFDGIDRRLDALVPTSIHLPLPKNFRLKRDIRRTDELVRRLIRERRSGGGGGDLLSRMARAKAADGSPMPEDVLRDEAMTMFQAGLRATPAAVCWTWHLLANNPDEERRVTEELSSLGEGTPSGEAIAGLTYTRAAVMESLRLYSPVYMTGRVPLRDAEIRGRPVKKGTTILMPEWLTHRDPEHFPDPEAFRPERWLDGLERRLPPFVYFPFGSGPRSCVGAELATLEMVAIVALAGRRHRVVPTTEVVAQADFLILPRDGMPVRLEPR